MRAVFALILLLCLTSAHAKTAYADRIVVDKSLRLMYVYVEGKVVKTYRIGLGLAPIGHKQVEGDRKTPEGTYVLDYKNPNSAYFRSIHIDYPNAADRARAKRAGVSPGGAIMIHGQPNDPRVRDAIRRWPSPDWTDGCISMRDADMRELWDRVRVPTPIEIRP